MRGRLRRSTGFPIAYGPDGELIRVEWLTANADDHQAACDLLLEAIAKMREQIAKHRDALAALYDTGAPNLERMLDQAAELIARRS
jgi:hypothetical protein